MKKITLTSGYEFAKLLHDKGLLKDGFTPAEFRKLAKDFLENAETEEVLYDDGSFGHDFYYGAKDLGYKLEL